MTPDLNKAADPGQDYLLQLFGRYLHYVQIVSGLFLIVIGVMMLTNQIVFVAIQAPLKTIINI